MLELGTEPPRGRPSARPGGPRLLGGTLGEYTLAQRRSFAASVVHFGQTLYLDDPPRTWYLALLCAPHSRRPVGRSSCDQCLWLSLMLWKQNRGSGARPDSHCSLRAALVCAASSSSALSMGARTNEAISIAAELGVEVLVVGVVLLLRPV